MTKLASLTLVLAFLAAFATPLPVVATTKEDLPPQMVPDPDAPLDPAFQDDYEIEGDGAVDPATGLPAAKGSGDMRLRSGANCTAVFDAKTGARAYICVMKASDQCVTLTNTRLRNFPGAKYAWLCPAPNANP